MKILLIHNTYQQHGGEDVVVNSEKELLKLKYHKLREYTVTNNNISGVITKIKSSINVSYSTFQKNEINKEIIRFKPEIVHVHNFFPIITPSVYDACIELNVPVVQTLHNFRTICPGALLMRNGKVCEKCIKHSAYNSFYHSCYRNSKLGTFAVARMVQYHRNRKTWGKKVNRFIALTEFSKNKFVEAGFPEEKIVVKPNFIDNPHVEYEQKREKSALFVGRLSKEKGIETLIDAWRKVEYSLNIAGSGPLLNIVTNSGLNKVTTLGKLSQDHVFSKMKRVMFLVLPSICYEGFPLVIAEAFAFGLPVLISRLGSMAEIVEDGVTGLHFEPGNADDLRKKAKWLFENPDECKKMGENARQVYEQKYTAEKNYQILMDIYNSVIEEHKGLFGAK